MLLMAGFEPRISGSGSDQSASWAILLLRQPMGMSNHFMSKYELFASW